MTTTPFQAQTPTPTTYDTLIKNARFQINAAKGSPSGSSYSADAFWSDDEFLDYARKGTTDLWAAIIDLHQEHFLSIDETNVSLASAATALSGVPLDCFRIYLIEPLDPTTNQCAFVPRPYNHLEFINARALSASAALTATTGVNIFYCMAGPGTPGTAPTVLTAPQVTSAVPVRFSYIPVLGVQNYTKASVNPIPGESDNALVAWIIAYALAKSNDSNTPDPAWLSVFATEKQSLLTRLAPRQEQDAQYIDGMFDSYWGR